MNVCRQCLCTDNSPCFTAAETGKVYAFEELGIFSDQQLDDMPLIPCHWIEFNLCSACVERPAPAPLLYGADGRPLRGAP